VGAVAAAAGAAAKTVQSVQGLKRNSAAGELLGFVMIALVLCGI
jgi:hypothetical protein